ncbi:chitobiase/beta-hexosaminidase C-terminal domain-containing protein [Treponema sp. UBA7570]|uniref:chitobiase/beta-hexosaminidase C-terminal domain-containing protein n=1 Tax=Treponema sp. UBA7570 TaxID=1947749 RepID=UPI0025E9871A|nr:chitobiase/beta-hexosaminidase C-terminal domain-containing protein [Treponema sp. UBA7570]
MMKKSRMFAVLAAIAIGLAVFGCKTEIETEYVDKTYAEAVTFTAEDAGEVGVKVAMASKTEGAAIYYTTDGTEPTENSEKYTEAVTFGKDTVVKAFAVKEGIENSSVSVANVSIKTKTITEKVYVCAKCQKEYATAQEAIDCCSEKTDTTETASFSVGSVVKVDGLDYIVVSNTITENSGSTASVIAALTTLDSIKKTKEYAEKTFGKNVLLIRVAGKVAVKHGTVPEFTELKKNIVPAVIPNGYSESDFFAESKETTPHYFYSDNFLVLGKEDLTDRLGFIKEQWHSKYYANFIDSENNSVAFEDALKAMNFILIRNYMPNEFKSYDKNNLLLNCYAFDEKQQFVEYYETCKESNYYSVNKTESPKPAFIVKDIYENNVVRKKTFNLMAVYGSEDTSSGIKYSISPKTSGGNTTYKVVINVGSDNNVYTKTIRPSEFDANGKYEGGSINLESEAYKIKITKNENATHYDDETLPYTAEIRQNIPVEFVLNDDGTVDFGESVYNWGRRWRDVIIEQNPEQAAVYPYY